MSGDLSRQARAWLKTRWIKSLGGVLATLLILAIITPFLLDVDRYRSRIADAISLQTGRQVTLGKIRATILPFMGFSIDGFQMSNPPNFAQGQFALADEVHGSLDFWPLLLRHELRIVSLELIEPRLILLEDGHGRNNYTFPPRRTVTPPSPKLTPAAGPNSTAVSVMMDQVTMKDAVISYGTVDQLGRQTATMLFANLDVELHQIILQPLRIHEWQADAQLGGTQLTLAGWNAPLLFDSGSVQLHDGKLELSFTLRFGNAARVDGTVTLPDIQNPVPQFDLKTNDLDLGALLAGTAEPARARAASFIAGGRTLLAATPASPQTAAAADRTIAPTADRLVAQGHIAAVRIRQGSAAAGPLSADLRIFSDRAEIWPFTLQLASGTVQVTARADRRQTPPRFSADIQVRGMKTEQLLEDSPRLKGKFAGAAEMEMQLLGSLDAHWPESLIGNGQFVIRNGRIAGFNLATAQSMASLAGLTGTVPFTRIAGDLAVRDQHISSRQIHMDSSRGSLDLKGTCGFYGSLNYEGQFIAQLGAALSPASDRSGSDTLSGILSSAAARNIAPAQITVPFALGGTLQEPQIHPGRTAPKVSRAVMRK